MTAENTPIQPRPRTRRHNTEGTTRAPLVSTIFYSATKDTRTEIIYLKVINTTGQKQPMEINLRDIGKISTDAKLIDVKGTHSEDTNTINDPEKIIPVGSKINDIAPVFPGTLDTFFVNILQLQA